MVKKENFLRLLRHSEKFMVSATGCIEWKAAKLTAGYGFMVERLGYDVTPRQKSHLAHRISWHFFRGNIPEGMCVLHRCDRPSCVNPNHLFIGTQKDNIRDCIKKGRFIPHGKNWTHCSHGHPFSGDNLGTYPSGTRYCKMCQKLNMRRYDQRKRES